MAVQKSNPHLALKKISLKIWSLRDQIETLLENNQHYMTQERVEHLLEQFNRAGLMIEYFEAEEIVKSIKEEGLELRPEVPENVYDFGAVFLTDMDINGMLFFSRKAFLPGQAILIEFQIPQRFIMSAQVVQCKDYNLAARIISTRRPKYRIQAKFSFTRQGERTLLRQFLQSISPVSNGNQASASSPQSDSAEETLVEPATAPESAGGGGDDVEDLLKSIAA